MCKQILYSKQISMNFIIVIAFTFSWYVLGFEDMVFGETSDDIIKKGKLEYQILQEKGKMPHYGECWKAAVQYLHDGCKFLSEDTQSDIALRFTNCFLEMSGHETYHCDTDIKPNLRRICISNMDDRAFSVYTEFYTHSQDICYFLRNQIWHEETEKTINNLSTTSAQVNEKLEEAGTKQETLLKQQEESISMQERLLNYGARLTKSLEESQQSIDHIMDEFRKSTLEQKRLLFDIFDRLSSLQSWIVGEISWLDTVIFYVCSVFVIVLITSTKRTANSRVICFILLTLHACVERSICAIVIDANKYEGIDYLNDLLMRTIWWLRRITIVIIIVVYTYFTYSYKDYNKLNYQLLLMLKDQNEIITKMLEKLNDTNEDKSNTDSFRYELNSLKEKTNNFENNLFSNVDKVDNLRRRATKNLYTNDTDAFDPYYPVNDLNTTDNRMNLENRKSIKKTFTVDSLLGTRYNLRSNSSRATTPDTQS